MNLCYAKIYINILIYRDLPIIQKHILHVGHAHRIKLVDAERFEKFFYRCHAVASGQIDFRIIRNERQTHFLLCRVTAKRRPFSSDCLGKKDTLSYEAFDLSIFFQTKYLIRTIRYHVIAGQDDRFVA